MGGKREPDEEDLDPAGTQRADDAGREIATGQHFESS
jgi:hypothetical protein